MLIVAFVLFLQRKEGEVRRGRRRGAGAMGMRPTAQLHLSKRGIRSVRHFSRPAVRIPGASGPIPQNCSDNKLTTYFWYR